LLYPAELLDHLISKGLKLVSIDKCITYCFWRCKYIAFYFKVPKLNNTFFIKKINALIASIL